eukprot:scaffold180236_cov55-Attheya_sp.AAC.2
METFPPILIFFIELFTERPRMRTQLERELGRISYEQDNGGLMGAESGKERGAHHEDPHEDDEDVTMMDVDVDMAVGNEAQENEKEVMCAKCLNVS